MRIPYAFVVLDCIETKIKIYFPETISPDISDISIENTDGIETGVVDPVPVFTYNPFEILPASPLFAGIGQPKTVTGTAKSDFARIIISSQIQ